VNQAGIGCEPVTNLYIFEHTAFNITVLRQITKVLYSRLLLKTSKESIANF